MKHFTPLLVSLLLLHFSLLSQAQSVIIPDDANQNDFLKAYKLVLEKTNSNYRTSDDNMDTRLFPTFGEYSVYWNKQGDFYIPDPVPEAYASVSSSPGGSYDWQTNALYCLQFKKQAQTIAILSASYKDGTATWEAFQFKSLFDSYLWNDMYHLIDEQDLAANGLSSQTKLLIIPSFSAESGDETYYIDKLFDENPSIKSKLETYLQNGGMIYAEGNAVYFIERLGYLGQGAVNFDNTEESSTNSLFNLSLIRPTHPLAFAANANNNKLYAIGVPEVNTGNSEIIARAESGKALIFTLEGQAANNGRIVCNLGVPTFGGNDEIQAGSRQLQWTLNTILYAFSQPIDVSRAVYNSIPDGVTANRNAIAYDRLDTFEVHIQVRNLSDKPLANVNITEHISNYFTFLDVQTSGITSNYNNGQLNIEGLGLAPQAQKKIIYRLITPQPEDTIHEDVDDFIVYGTHILPATTVVDYASQQGLYSYTNKRAYAELMFAADIAADTDVNWKNFLGLDYQPFKVFMMMENKGRTSAMNSEYIQYIPKDVPFYWSDKSINIPILKTPGGKFVDVLRGSNDEANPEYDMDSDGHPDVWLDTASIYPKGYTIIEEEVYWLNPWEHLRTGESYYEDIDHDGIRAQDIDGDGVVDIEEPGDKIRVWKVVWDMDEIPGLQVYDPYCSYEIWVDPPDLVPLAAGVAYAHDKLDKDVDNKFYPFAPDIDAANLADTAWSHWMERDEQGEVIWKQLVFQSQNNYEGFTFIDTANTNYKLQPTDYVAGTVPQPHREFLAVLSMGGEEIDMYKPTPQQSLYSKVNYQTIFGEHKTTPIRTTYTYYAPLPNPLQFEYLSNSYTITTLDKQDTLRYLPNKGKVNLTFEMDASTEYTYYWIRNVGHDVDYNDPSLAIEGHEEMGDGVFGYLIYDIPKGMGGYKIHLPMKEDGSYDTDSLVKVDGQPFKKWLDNENTGNEIEVWEDPFAYHVYIPQLLIPPALDDDNFDAKDDWIDDRGDRFKSETGFLHDHFMLGDGEDYPADNGWSVGDDGTRGDDDFENLGKTHFTIHTQYEGKGKEGSVDISKGGWLVVEEIFGGSPWVIFSHSLQGYAKGLNVQVKSEVMPSVINYGEDTTYIKYTIEDANEPHFFDHNFDPYRVSYGYGEATVTTYAGGKDPCSLIEPAVRMSNIIDPESTINTYNFTLIPEADADKTDLAGYPKQVSGSFFEVLIEVTNGTDDNWLNTSIDAQIPAELGNTEVVMSYVAYPRPLVPGDDIGAFEAGWRFNEPEGEVLVKMGNTLPLLQPSRRAYFVMLVKIDADLTNGIYEIPFVMAGDRQHYDGSNAQQLAYDVPPVAFSITKRNSNGNILKYMPLVIGQGQLDLLTVNTTERFTPLGDVRWSPLNVNPTDFNVMTNSLSSSYEDGQETINLSELGAYPDVDMNKIYLLEAGVVNSYGADLNVPITRNQTLTYTYDVIRVDTLMNGLIVQAVGPKVLVEKFIKSINGLNYSTMDSTRGFQHQITAVVTLKASNVGNDVAKDTRMSIVPGKYFRPLLDSLPAGSVFEGKRMLVDFGKMIPGGVKELDVHWYVTSAQLPQGLVNEESEKDWFAIQCNSDIDYVSAITGDSFHDQDMDSLFYGFYDLYLHELIADRMAVEPGTKLQLTATAQNRAKKTRDVSMKLYMIQGRDTSIVETQNLEEVAPGEIVDITFDYLVPDSIFQASFFVEIDADKKFTELIENNNKKALDLPLYRDPVLSNVEVYPVPFNTRFTFAYAASQELDDLRIEIYDMFGGKVQVIDDCSRNSGYNYYTVMSTDFAQGTYFYRLVGSYSYNEPTGKTVTKEEQHTGILIKQ